MRRRWHAIDRGKTLWLEAQVAVPKPNPTDASSKSASSSASAGVPCRRSAAPRRPDRDRRRRAQAHHPGLAHAHQTAGLPLQTTRPGLPQATPPRAHRRRRPRSNPGGRHGTGTPDNPPQWARDRVAALAVEASYRDRADRWRTQNPSRDAVERPQPACATARSPIPTECKSSSTSGLRPKALNPGGAKWRSHHAQRGPRALPRVELVNQPGVQPGPPPRGCLGRERDTPFRHGVAASAREFSFRHSVA